MQQALLGAFHVLRVVVVFMVACLLRHIGRLPEFCSKDRRTVESGQSIYDAAISVQNVMDAVTCNRSLQLTAVAKRNCHPRCRTDRLPMQDEPLLQ